jgi:hypothetical protein
MKRHSSSTSLATGKTTDFLARQILGFAFIRAKDLSKILAAKIKISVQDQKSCWLNPSYFNISLSSTQNVTVLNRSLHKPPLLFLVVRIFIPLLGRVSTARIARPIPDCQNL